MNPRPTILVVEDEPEIRRFLRSSLEAEGYRVAESSTARRGVIDAGTHKPDVAIVDLGPARLRRGGGRPSGSGKWSAVPILDAVRPRAGTREDRGLRGGRGRLRDQAVRRRRTAGAASSVALRHRGALHRPGAPSLTLRPRRWSTWRPAGRSRDGERGAPHADRVPAASADAGPARSAWWSRTSPAAGRGLGTERMPGRHALPADLREAVACGTSWKPGAAAAPPPRHGNRESGIGSSRLAIERRRPPTPLRRPKSRAFAFGLQASARTGHPSWRHLGLPPCSGGAPTLPSRTAMRCLPSPPPISLRRWCSRATAFSLPACCCC